MAAHVPQRDGACRALANAYQSVKTHPMKRRALVLTNESARHPFRASLPPFVTARAGEIEFRVPWRQMLALTRRDAQQLAATYVAGFVATLSFVM